ncbi:MAG: glycoside hydrolase family 3 N-terminal domain-containing protein [Sphingopyxis sp.]
MIPAFFGLSGPVITREERAFFADVRPAGYIIFARNILDHAQLRALTADLRGLDGRSATPILVDQEGGRVARLRGPLWPDFPPAHLFGQRYAAAPISAIAAARCNATAMAIAMRDVGVNMNCAPLVDLRQPMGHDVITSRTFADAPSTVAALGRAVLNGLADGGVVGVIKHMPGQGRAVTDSHVDAPIIDACAADMVADLAPFAALADAPMGMTSHARFALWDAARPATLSPTIIHTIIRQQMGFAGLLMSDGLEMHALPGSPADRAAGALAAGCDIALHCNAVLAEMRAIADRIAPMDGAAVARLDRAMQCAAAVPDQPADAAAQVAQWLARRDELLGDAAQGEHGAPPPPTCAAACAPAKAPIPGICG